MSSDTPTDAKRDHPDPDSLRTNLQALAARLGKTPTVVEMHEQGDYHPEKYVEAFGGWDAALDAAGLDPGESANKIPDHELLAELQRLYQILDRSPSQQDMNKYGTYSDNVYKIRFGSWNEAMQAAMLDTTERSGEIPELELLRELERLAGELGRVPTVSDMDSEGGYGVATYYRRFGGWAAALAEADFSQVDF